MSKTSSKISPQRDLRRLGLFFDGLGLGDDLGLPDDLDALRIADGRTSSRSPWGRLGNILRSCSGAPQVEQASSCLSRPFRTRAARVPQ